MSIKNKQEFNRYSISIYDFEKCIKFLRELEEFLPSSLAYESLLVCAVIYYYRPFTKNEKNNNAKATPNLNICSFHSITHVEKNLHNQCKMIRNKALSHSEWSKYPTKLKLETNVIVSNPYNILSENIDLVSLLNLAEKMRRQCHHMRADYCRSQKI